MQTPATLIEKLAIQTGEGKNGPWKKQDILLEIGDQYKKKLCVTVWGDKVNIEELQIGDNLTVHLALESRQYQEKWYSDIKAWKIEKNGDKAAHSDSTYKKEDLEEIFYEAPAAGDDLPF